MTKLRPLVMIAVVLVIAGVTVILAGGRFPWSESEPFPSAEPDSCDIPKSVAVAPVRAAPGIRVADQGFTQGDNGQLSIGAVLENTTDRVAYRTRITFNLFDAAHTPINRLYPLDADVPVILPGQRIGTGISDLQHDPKAASFEVEIKTTTWLPGDALGSFSPITGKYLRTLPGDPQMHLVSVHYQETSTNCRLLYTRKTAAIFRDAEGKIVGGDLQDPTIGFFVYDEKNRTISPEIAPSTPTCSPGERETWIVPHTGRVPGADETRTEVYPYCDLPN